MTKNYSDPIKFQLDGKEHVFDLDEPKLPGWIKDNDMSSGGYPYEEKLDRDDYEDQLETLQEELIKLQYWQQEKGTRIIMLFEGRDAAGKGGTIKAITQNMNPRHARVVALPKPSDRERGEWYFQRYVRHFPTSGEMVLFDRSWYNRAGVEPVMEFCTPEQHQTFLQEAPDFERMIVREGIFLFKFWLNVGREMQLKRFHDRRHDPLKIWKLSPIDIKALSKWDDYTAARDLMLERTHDARTPWTIIRSNDKRRARLNAIRRVLSALDYDGKKEKNIGDIDPAVLGEGPAFLSAGSE
ncbi:polyphosphate kinase 2 [Parvularcula sp. IMCC14364]|uniref:polyphosphate kinase 2 n=1 Tax=Parvularcula sp. IMCC14364 TaxID=3067902 RepID=UPI002741925C|nr:polyphosphate kinase 2 [Parvularcula sp. IMCC14364]